MQSTDQLQTLIVSSIEAELRSLRWEAHDISPGYTQLLAAAATSQLAWYAAQKLVVLALERVQTTSLPSLISAMADYDEPWSLQLLLQLLEHVATCVEAHRKLIRASAAVLTHHNMQPSVKDRLFVGNSVPNFDRCLTEIMNKTMPPPFPGVLRDVLRTCLASMSAAHLEEDEVMSNSHTPLALEGIAACLRTIGLGRLLDDTAAEVVHEHVNQHVQVCAEDSTKETVLDSVLRYAETVSMEFLRRVFLVQSTSNGAALKKWHRQLQDYVLEAVCTLRTASLFDLIIDYPETLPALQDLRTCLQHTHAHRKLVQVFSNAIQARLLHPGAATQDIIGHYVSTIRALHHVDPSGTILAAVSGPLREYLRKRKDAIRCIVILLTDENTDATGEAFLSDLVRDGGPTPNYDVDLDFMGANADEQAYQAIIDDRWEPGPLEIVPLQTSSLTDETPSKDVITMLVNIYGTKELFVSEYRSMLADRLLAKTDFDCDKELRTLELLKVRFGESTLHAAEVMLRDLADSKRLNANVRTVANTATPLKHCSNLVPIDSLSVAVMSELFWPNLMVEEFKLPLEVQRMLETFGHKYHALKAPRVLQWKPSLGSVSLTLTIGKRRLDFDVPPLLATILLRFRQHAEWTLGDLAEQLKIPAPMLRRKMVYWINQGVIGEFKDMSGAIFYRRYDEVQRPAGTLALGNDGMEGMDDDAGCIVQDGMASFEPFVIGMLTNFDALSLDRIHNMLKMFVTDPPYDKSLEELNVFMGKLSTEDKVVLEGGVYKRRGQ